MGDEFAVPAISLIEAVANLQRSATLPLEPAEAESMLSAVADDIHALDELELTDEAIRAHRASLRTVINALLARNVAGEELAEPGWLMAVEQARDRIDEIVDIALLR